MGQGAVSEPYCRDKGANAEFFDEQKERAAAVLEPWENQVTSLDEEAVDAPLPTGVFWTTLLLKESNPWETGRKVGNRFMKGTMRTLTTFESQTGADLIRKEVLERAGNAGLDTDRDFSDSRVHLR